MGQGLRRRIRQEKFESPIQEAVLNVLVAAGYLRDEINRACERHDITSTQYNVLRILKGVAPAGHPRGEINRRMLERAPDVTRLIDRLEARGLAERIESERDRRLSMTRITPAGLALLEKLKPIVDGVLDEMARRLTPGESQEISRLCEKLYEEPPDRGGGEEAP